MSNLVPEGWEYKPLSSLANIDKGSLKASTDSDYKFWYIDIASVSTGRIDLPFERISFAEAPSRARKKVQSGDVLMSTVRPNLKSFAYFEAKGNDYIASTGFSVIRAVNGNDGRFLFNSILADDITRQIEAKIVGSNYPAINSSDVKNLEVLTPTKPEQKKIAAILTSVDDVIEKTQAQIDKLKDLKTGMMQELFTLGIGVDGKPHTEFKDSPVGRIPKGWKVCHISDVADVKGGKRLPKGAPFAESKTPYPYIRISDFSNGSIDVGNIKYVRAEVREKIKRYTISQNDLYVSIAGVYLGLFGEVPEVLDGALLTENAAKIVFKDTERQNKTFVRYLCQSSLVQSQLLQEKGVGAGVPKLALFRIAETYIALPDRLEQNRISDTIASVDSYLNIKRQSLEKLRNAKRALMQDLLSGKIRVKVED